MATNLMEKPLDARLAALIVSPFRRSTLQPNHLTAVRLVIGLAGVASFASGQNFLLGAWLIFLSNFLDHADGEFARMTGRYSRFGHYFDLISDAIITIGLFVGLGIGLAQLTAGFKPVVMGVVAGVAVASIFHIRNKLEAKFGKQATEQARIGVFEAEDILYLLPLVVAMKLLPHFLVAAAVGAPIALIFVLIHAHYFSSSHAA